MTDTQQRAPIVREAGKPLNSIARGLAIMDGKWS